MAEEIIKKGAVSDMIAIVKKNVSSGRLSSGIEQSNLIKHCTVAIGRVAETDEKQLQKVIEEGALETLILSLDIKDKQVIISCLNTLDKLCANESVKGKIASMAFIKKALDITQGFLKDEEVAEGLTHFLGTMASDESAVAQIVENKGLIFLFFIIEKMYFFFIK